MSYDLRIAVKVAGVPKNEPDLYVVIAEPELSNPTYNLGEMFRACTGWDYDQGEFYKVSDVYENIKRVYDVPKQEQSTTLKIDTRNVSEKDKNFSKNKVKFKAESLTQYNPKEQELISKIYGIIGKILPHDEADFIINKIQESLANES